MKPSLRRDSLEKAARKIARSAIPIFWYAPRLRTDQIFEVEQKLEVSIIRLLQRHGAKVRRETLKEAAEIARATHTYCDCSTARGGRCFVKRDILSLTPRGPEKWRRQ